ncbi:MAG: anti-sigma factor [Myxococcota bacterium]
MSGCDFPKIWLMAWMDGEAGKRAERVRQHLEHCPSCAHEVDAWQRAGDELRTIVDVAVGAAEPLVALQRIRAKVAEAESRTIGVRLRAWWGDMWLMNRRVLVGVSVAAAVGALAAPGMVYWLGSSAPQMRGPTTASVVVESLKVGGNVTAVVLESDNGSTTLIWVEPTDDATSSEESL